MKHTLLILFCLVAQLLLPQARIDGAEGQPVYIQATGMDWELRKFLNDYLQDFRKTAVLVNPFAHYANDPKKYDMITALRGNVAVDELGQPLPTGSKVEIYVNVARLKLGTNLVASIVIEDAYMKPQDVRRVHRIFVGEDKVAIAELIGNELVLHSKKIETERKKNQVIQKVLERQKELEQR